MNKVCCCSNPVCMQFGCQDKSQGVIPLTVDEYRIPPYTRPLNDPFAPTPLTEADVRRIIIKVLQETGLIYPQAYTTPDTKQWPKPYPEYSLKGNNDQQT